jgi:hypothetical protein
MGQRGGSALPRRVGLREKSMLFKPDTVLRFANPPLLCYDTIKKIVCLEYYT